MAYFVNPAGEVFEGDAKDAKDLESQGLRPASADDITKHNENVGYAEKGLAGKAGDIATAGLQGVARGAMAPGLALQRAITGTAPGAEAGRDQSALSESAFGPEAEARKGRHDGIIGASTIGESLPMLLGGAALPGAELGLAGKLGVLGGESAAFGMSQEAVDAVTAKRDFSVAAAGMNGLTNLALGAVGFGAGKAWGRFLGRGVAAAGEAAGEATGGAVSGAVSGAAGAEGGAAAGEAPRVKRNWLGQIDKGPVPEEAPLGPEYSPEAAKRKPGEARSVGAAGGNFDDSTAAKSIGEMKEGKVNPGPIAEAAPAMREHLASEGARTLDVIQEITRDDANLATKHRDFVAGAEKWTPEIKAAQDDFVVDMRTAGERLANELADTPHAGGLGEAAREEIAKGLQRVAEADEGAARNVAIDNYKRGLDNLRKRVTKGVTGAVDNITRQKIGDAIGEHADVVRKGLEKEELFGANGPLQAAENAAQVEVIDPFRRVQKRLYEYLGKDFGETGVSGEQWRADPSALRRVFEDPHMGGELFKRDLKAALDGVESRAAAREGHGTYKLERIGELKQALNDIRDDFNTAQVLQFAEERAGGGGHGAAGVSGAANAIAGVGIHAAEAVSLAHGLPIGRAARGFYGPVGRAVDSAARAGRRLVGLPMPEIAKAGTATREVLDRYAARVRNVDALMDTKHVAGLSEPHTTLLKKANAGIAAAGVAAVGAGLAGEGQAGAAELPADKQNRDAVDAQLRSLSPEEQAVHARTAEAFARIQKQTESKVKSAVDELFRTATDPGGKPRTQSRQEKALDDRAQELGVARPVARFMGRKTDDPVEAWQEKSELLTSIMQDPGKLARAMAENLGDLPKLQPEIFTSMVSQTMAVASYLHDWLPQASGKSLTDPEGYPPSLEDITEYAARWVGALHPLETLDDLAQNDILPEQMEAVQALHPDAYTLFQTTALEHLHALGQSGREVPMDALAQLDGALDLKGAGEPLLSPEMARLIQQAQAAQQGKPAGGPPGGASPGATQGQPVPLQSKEPARLASASLASLHGEAGA